jgi:hypothetical protein
VLSLGQAVLANDVIVVAAKINNVATVSLSTLTDDHNDTYSFPFQVKTSGYTHVIAYATVANAAPTTTITATLISTVDGGKANTVLYATKYTGLVVPAAIDAMVGTSPPLTSGLASTSFSHEVIFGFGVSSGGISAGPLFSPIAAFLDGFIESRVVDCPGPYEATAVVAEAGAPWVMMMATFPGN